MQLALSIGLEISGSEWKASPRLGHTFLSKHMGWEGQSVSTSRRTRRDGCVAWAATSRPCPWAGCRVCTWRACAWRAASYRSMAAARCVRSTPSPWFGSAGSLSRLGLIFSFSFHSTNIFWFSPSCLNYVIDTMKKPTSNIFNFLKQFY